jgi:hypothetical protein
LNGPHRTLANIYQCGIQWELSGKNAKNYASLHYIIYLICTLYISHHQSIVPLFIVVPSRWEFSHESSNVQHFTNDHQVDRKIAGDLFGSLCKHHNHQYVTKWARPKPWPLKWSGKSRSKSQLDPGVSSPKAQGHWRLETNVETRHAPEWETPRDVEALNVACPENGVPSISRIIMIHIFSMQIAICSIAVAHQKNISEVPVPYS